eukprot:5926900-Amphidinium_carterae.1
MIVEAAKAARAKLQEELITVYARLEKLPSESLPVPKPAVVPSYTGQREPAPNDGLGQPATTISDLLQEAQRVYDQLADTPDVHRMLETVDQEAPVDNVPAAPTTFIATPMEDDKEEQLRLEQPLGGQDADEVMAEDRKRIRTLRHVSRQEQPAKATPCYPDPRYLVRKPFPH